MAVFSKGNFSLNLGIITLGGELTDGDRQCAWELYSELATRVAITGKRSDPECLNFEGEVLIESLESMFVFFGEARSIMRIFPVGKIEGDKRHHLGVVIGEMLNQVIRPFLEEWQADYRHWWNDISNPRLSWTERQNEYPKLTEFLDNWTNLRLVMQELEKELVETYNLVEIPTGKT